LAALKQQEMDKDSDWKHREMMSLVTVRTVGEMESRHKRPAGWRYASKTKDASAALSENDLKGNRS
jgi:hypothetical protein